MALLADTWPIWGALALVGVITYGALRPAIKAAKQRRDTTETKDD
ncbi:hypothetical protein P775_09170 [Puniceibacterium antarcticum]|uniref:Uncharacterized protein n=1 Tax=Puniceibacterium antarcticum TaxID=1206336 RepID=A0A2G8RHX4_9RHOB|nr:hypothetical protein P775_09170 [Puniceibacterium antarcticum]